ncbi:hypothetical protein [Paenibacillus sp. 1781tsa1]|uniref:hypothetical protein n=1 Tax=Paenibacillus sp. 1781tsa1 TaxID=2953810 RepID=UPI00209D2FC7|nr:hypothetical protein [Paenibacillus sp. 1781tsa1]MCP1185903.1 hypothetical protein [Paenibacillus sp. 1781tsa1]
MATGEEYVRSTSLQFLLQYLKDNTPPCKLMLGRSVFAVPERHPGIRERDKGIVAREH